MAGRPDPRRLGDRPEPAEEPPAAEPPPAPEPRGNSTFNRELFLLRLVAFVLISQMALYTGATAFCAFKARDRALPQDSACGRMDSELSAAFALALNTLLALLGGKAIIERER